MVSRMSTQLQTLAYEHVELANILTRLTRSTGVTEAGAVGSAVAAMSKATRDLATALSTGPANTWHEGAAFGEVIKKVLKYRLSFQVSGCCVVAILVLLYILWFNQYLGAI